MPTKKAQRKTRCADILQIAAPEPGPGGFYPIKILLLILLRGILQMKPEQLLKGPVENLFLSLLGQPQG